MKKQVECRLADAPYGVKLRFTSCYGYRQSRDRASIIPRCDYHVIVIIIDGESNNGIPYAHSLHRDTMVTYDKEVLTWPELPPSSYFKFKNGSRVYKRRGPGYRDLDAEGTHVLTTGGRAIEVVELEFTEVRR